MPSLIVRILSALVVLASMLAAQDVRERYVLETSRGPDAAAARLAMQRVQEGLAVSADEPIADEPRGDCVVWHPSPDDQTAMGFFRAAAHTGDTGRRALISLAATTPNIRVARRALAHAFVRSDDAEQCGPLLLHLLERDDPILESLATQLLVDLMGKTPPPALRRALAERALAEWPADDFPWSDLFECGGSGFGVWASAPREQLRRVRLAVAASTGDSAVVARLLGWYESGADGAVSPPRRQCALDCLALAAPHVDADMARKLHERFMPVATAPRNHDRAVRAIACILIGVFPQVPRELLPTFGRLFDDDGVNTWMRCRAMHEVALPGDRLRLLILPLAREYDRELMLRAPDLVVGALRGTPAERERMIHILDGSARNERLRAVPRGPGSPCFSATREHWQAVMPAILELPEPLRNPLLDRLATLLATVGIELDADVAQAQSSCIGCCNRGTGLQSARGIRPQVMRHLTAALAVPGGDAEHATAGWRPNAAGEAVNHFIAAAREGVDGVLAVLSLAATTADAEVARRAVLAAEAVVDASSRERAVPMLLELVEHGDPSVAFIAANALDRHVGQALSQSVRDLVVARAMARWPADELELRMERQSTGGCSFPSAPTERRRWPEAYSEVIGPGPVPGPHRDAMHVPSRLVRAAAATGSRCVYDRLMACAAPSPRPNPNDPRIALQKELIHDCLRLAAPNVDPDIARGMHSWFLPDLAGPRPQWAVDMIANLFLSVPDDLLPSYAPLLRDESKNLEFRRRLLRTDAIPVDRVRMLLLPLERERDRSLMLRAPKLVVAALRGSDAEQVHMIDLLCSQNAELCEVAARHWQVVLPAIMELPECKRSSLLSRRANEFARLCIDVQPFAQTALPRPADQRD